MREASAPNGPGGAAPLTPAQRAAFAVLLLCGAALRLWQYFGRASLWLDELSLSANILHRPFGALVSQPLLNDQVAPPGFLASEKVATALLGDGELALRLVSFVAGLAAMVLFAAVARRLLETRGAILATALFTLGVPFVRYSAEVKQYSSDVAFALLLTLVALALPSDRERPRDFWIAGLIGAIVIWFSQPAVFVLGAAGIALVVERLSRARIRTLPRLLPTAALWGASAGLSVVSSFRRTTPEMRTHLWHYWRAEFPSVAPGHAFGAPFLLTSIRNFWGGSGMLYRVGGLFIVLGLIGVVVLWTRRGPRAALMVALPTALTFAAAAAQLYPFGARVTLFLGPFYLLAAAAGAMFVAGLLTRAKIPAAATAAILAVPAVLAIVRNPPVYHHEEVRPLFERLARERRDGDGIYVFHEMKQALDYYGARFRLDPRGVTVGSCHRADLPGYLREIDALRGRPRAWVLIAHAQSKLSEQETIRAYCDRIGRRLETSSTPDGRRQSTLDLYDFSDPVRLASSSAESFPLPVIDPETARRLACSGALPAADPLAP